MLPKRKKTPTINVHGDEFVHDEFLPMSSQQWSYYQSLDSYNFQIKNLTSASIPLMISDFLASFTYSEAYPFTFRQLIRV